MGLGNALPPATNWEVNYSWYGEPARAIFLTKDGALSYIEKLHLRDAKLNRCWNEECIAALLAAATESTADNGITESDSALYAVKVLPSE